MTVLTCGEKREPAPTPGGAFAHWYGIVGASRALTNVIRRIELVSATRSTVLIIGETGTGKELVARAIHDAGARRRMPFVTVNCAAIPATLLESELFGHVRGAFTGAASTRKGRFFLAHGGTIFLDEIGTMSADLQSKLLRVLQEREIEPLGAERTVPVDVRVVAATNRDLRQLVASGLFQEDLFYRLNVIPIVVPPLRERLDDIPLLVDHFVARHAAHSGKRISALEDGVIELLQSHGWPGNVRELENTIERAVVLTMGDTIPLDAITIDATVPPGRTELPSFRLRDNIEWIECETIRQALLLSTTKQHAATLLGISPRALSHYLAKYRFIDGDVTGRRSYSVS
jgi:transcriptional regulator with GAF, ATPase, and Fis domain